MILPAQRKAILWLLNLVLTGFGLNGQATFEIDTFQHSILLKDYAEILSDPNDQYELVDFLKDPKEGVWKPLNQSSNAMFPSKNKPWVRLNLQNQLAAHQTWVLNVSFVNDSIIAYAIRESGQIDSFKVGRLVPPTQAQNGSTQLKKLYLPSHPIFLELPKGEQVVLYLKVYTHFFDRVYLNPKLQSIEKTTSSLIGRTKHYVKGFFYAGLVWMFLFYNLLIFIFYRNLANLYLAFFALCFAAPGEFIVLTWMNKTWFPDFPLLIYGELIVLVPLIYVFMARFIRQFLKTKKQYPRVHQYMKILEMVGWLYLMFSIALFIIQGGPTQGKIRETADLIVLIAAFIIFMLMLLKIYQVKQSNVRFLLAGCLFLLLSQLFSMVLLFLNIQSWMNAINQVIYPVSLADIGVLGFIGILTLGLGHESRKTFQEKTLLEEKDQLKSRFYANLSHEFRTPLTLILGPIQSLLEKVEDSEDRQMLEIMQRNANRQLRLVNSLLTLAKLEANQIPLNLQTIEVVQFLKGVLFSYESLAEQKGIQLNFKSQVDSLVLKVDTEKVEVILFNLLSNAFRHTKTGGKIGLNLAIKGKQVQISVSDDGTGIEPEYLPKLFDRFFYATNEKTTTNNSGIGLALSLELAKIHDGTIEVESTLGIGSVFKVCLPLEKSTLSPIQVIPPKASIAAEVMPVVTELSTVKSGARVLIVEDHGDVRQFIRRVLDPIYEVREAVNGKEGLEAALEFDPELIISDVMMPEMDGFEFCKRLKTDLTTSHIPVILLTAKAAHAEKMEGLETGADDYLVKPFNTQELLVRIQNLIQLRQNLRQRFASSIFLKPAEIKTNSLDQTFLNSVMEALENNMTNEDFKVEALAKAVQVSKATLNRKLRALLDQSANDFIKSVRLQRAASLLAQRAGTVSEIAFQTGFRSTAYFVKSFKDYFGVTPGNYQGQ